MDKLLFISHFVFRSQPAAKTPKMCQMKAFHSKKKWYYRGIRPCVGLILGPSYSYGPAPNVLRNWSVPSPSWFLWHAGSSNFFQYFPPPLFENESVVLCTLTVLFSTKYLQFFFPFCSLHCLSSIYFFNSGYCTASGGQDLVLSFFINNSYLRYYTPR